MAKNDRQKKELKPCHYRAVTALVVSGDISAAADSVGVSERTLRRWMALPAFQAELRNAETELVQAAARRLGHLTDKAVSVLEGILDDDRAAVSPRIRAATVILDTCLRWREQVVLDDRIKALEQHVGERK